ncbi:hypothetical protein UlMin_006092 [Ulmus minor]
MSDKETVVSIEELCAMKMTQSNDNNSYVVSTSEVRKVISFSEEESSDIADIDELVEAEKGKKEAPVPDKPKIQKVPIILRDNKDFNKLYEPRAIPIGPIHYKNERLKLARRYKPRLAARFIKESGKSTRELYEKIKAEMEALKLLFDPEVIEDYKEDELSWMLFLDGCSTLQFIYGFAGDRLKEYNIKSDQVAFAQQDLFLLENQIPFKVLTLLIDSSTAKKELIKSIKSFLQTNVMAPSHMWESIEIDIYKEDPTHLLELLQKFAIHQSSTKDDKFSDKKLSLLSCLMREKQNTSEQSFPTIKELIAAGIDLKPSKTHSLKDINFNSSCLKLPPLSVDDSTGPKLLNWVMCPDNFRTNYEVSSYVIFLDLLIDNSNDVKELKSAKILFNHLGSDDVVARLFNEIATDLVSCPSLYRDVLENIQKYYTSTLTVLVKTWMAEAYATYFKSPWTILAFLGALIALALTIVQTWYAINPPPDNHRN